MLRITEPKEGEFYPAVLGDGRLKIIVTGTPGKETVVGEVWLFQDSIP